MQEQFICQIEKEVRKGGRPTEVGKTIQDWSRLFISVNFEFRFEIEHLRPTDVGEARFLFDLCFLCSRE